MEWLYLAFPCTGVSRNIWCMADDLCVQRLHEVAESNSYIDKENREFFDWWQQYMHNYVEGCIQMLYEVQPNATQEDEDVEHVQAWERFVAKNPMPYMMSLEKIHFFHIKLHDMHLVALPQMLDELVCLTEEVVEVVTEVKGRFTNLVGKL